MSVKIKDASGEEKEHFTQEEVDKKLEDQKSSITEENKKTTEDANKEAIENYKKEHPDQTEKIEKMETDLKKTTEELEKAGGKKEDKNETEQVKRLRQERDDAKKLLDEGMKTMADEIKGIKETTSGNTKTKAFDKLAGDDKELREKIELEFDHYKPEDTSEKGIIERAGKAYQLATGDAPKPNFMDNVTGGGGQKGSSETEAETTEKKATENEKEIGKKFGVTDADREKFGDKGDQLTPPEQIV